MLPTAEVFDSVTGQTAFVANPVTPRLSFIAGSAYELRRGSDKFSLGVCPENVALPWEDADNDFIAG